MKVSILLSDIEKLRNLFMSNFITKRNKIKPIQITGFRAIHKKSELKKKEKGTKAIKEPKIYPEVPKISFTSF